MKPRRLVENHLEGIIATIEVFGNRQSYSPLAVGYKDNLEQLEIAIRHYEEQGHNMTHYWGESNNLRQTQKEEGK